MRRWIICAAACVLLGQTAAADEGMWLIQQLGRGVYPQMRAEGLKLKPGEIYNESSPALSDAVVAVDGGMGSGSMISDEGLMITNHHVAYSDICALSTCERNCLEMGFWAQTREQEIPVKGKTVSFLRKVIDITSEANKLKDSLKTIGKWGSMGMRRLSGELEARYQKDTPYEVWFSSMWNGEQHLMYFYEVYKDVRLVGAPPVTIGAFGGDTDNWSWPQHKGDFALYRIYADKEGRPAEYSADNVPVKPRHVLPVAMSGVHDDDFAMVIGFPGRTNRYASSFAIEEKQKIKNPIVVANRQDRMEIIRKHMERDPEVRMKYSDAFFGLSNYADYAKWETICLRRYEVSAIRAAEEAALTRWIEADPQRKAFYGDLLNDLKRGCDVHREALRALTYFQETWFGQSEALLMANRVTSYLAKLDRMKCDTLDICAKDARSVVSNSARLCENYDAATDRDLLAKMVANFTAGVPRDMWGKYLNELYDRYKGNTDRLARDAFDASFCSDPDRYDACFTQNRPVEELRRDPLIALMESVSILKFSRLVEDAECKAGIRNMDKLKTLYAKALYDFRADRGVVQYPNANSTMRLSYGTVGSVSPSDGIHYDSRSTVAGYVEKYNPDDYNFRVDERMRSLIAARDWGRWGEKGELYVNFLTNNDITGGNSGSPVMDARGRLVGLAFDGNRESMAGDLYFHPTLSKTVCVDIRFVMWVIEKYAGADYLLGEMKFEK